MEGVVIRRTTEADVHAVAALRRAWHQEQHGPSNDPDFEDRFAAWYLAESPRRITWVAEINGRMVGMVNLAVFTRMPRPR